MAQAAGGHSGHILFAHFGAALKSREGAGCSVGDDVATQAIHIQFAADRGDAQAQILIDHHLLQPLLSFHHPLLKGFLVVVHRCAEPVGVTVECCSLVHHLHPQLRVAHGAHLNAHAEAIQQLRTQFPLLGVSGADEHEAGGVADGHAFTLDRVPPGGG